MRRTARSIVVAAAGVVLATPVLAQQPAPQPQPAVRPGAQSAITIRGFVGATAFLQDASFAFGNGQNAAWVTSAPEANQWILSGDIRNTRIGLDFRGPPIGGGWGVGGTVEMDFFGGFATTGFNGDEQPLPRLRLAYVDVARGGTTVRVGQFWSPLFGYAPASVSHLGFPLGLGVGNVGWRFPGIFFYQTLTDAQATTQAQLQIAAMRGSWDGGTAANVNHLSPGETSGFPQLQARLDFTGRTTGGMQWSAYAVAHYDQKDMRPYGTGGPEQRIDGSAFAAGLRVVPGPLTLHGSAYTGRAVGQQLAHITQIGDIGGWGAWGQAGLALTPNWSAWLFYGMDDPDDADLPAVDTRLQNRLGTAMLRYATGPYQLGVEWLRAETDWRAATGTDTRTGNQWALSVLYSF